jgi:hypothetical protein
MVEGGFKECKERHSEKPLDQFHKHPRTSDGRYNYCIPAIGGETVIDITATRGRPSRQPPHQAVDAPRPSALSGLR